MFSLSSEAGLIIVEAAKVKDRIEQRPERPTVAPFRLVLARGIGVTSSLSGP